LNPDIRAVRQYLRTLPHTYSRFSDFY
jgi:hypothetical protein